MAFPPQRREPLPDVPSIIVPSPTDHFRSDHDSPYSRSSAMSIPSNRPRQYAPPPLPPPRRPLDHPFEDMSTDRRPFPPSQSSLVSGYGSADSSLIEDQVGRSRGYSKNRNDSHDEGYASWSLTKRPRDNGLPEFGVHHTKFQLQSHADLSGASMKNMLRPSLASDKSSLPSLFSPSSNQLLSRRHHAEPSYLSELSSNKHMHLPLPIRNHEPITPYSAVSPRSAPFQPNPSDYRTPPDSYDIDPSPRTHKPRNNSDDVTTPGGYDYDLADGMELEDTSELKKDLKRFHLNDSYGTTRSKRKAASPPPEHSIPGQPHIARWGDTSSRGSPVPRLAKSSQGTPLPSLSRSNSHMSSLSITPSSATTIASYDKRSPGHSPDGISPISATSPFTNTISLNPSPRGSISSRTTTHTRAGSISTPRIKGKIERPVGSKIQFHMCECCPKKPKKFETIEELRTHESEKQYNCSYCGNRFKNKNEAERHQNSLHVRRHSWSCSVLIHYERAFHESTNAPGEADTCGYCGEDFLRSGVQSMVKYPTEQDRIQRQRHLQDVHKFGECNTNKKFFRADHFRQHLKHSHAGASGKWTNMLENACMMEEEPAGPQWTAP